MNVPLLDLRAQYNVIRDKIEPALIQLAQSQMMILGPEVEQLEKSIAGYSGANYAIGCSSGTDALLMALMALDLQPGDEVILPTYSFFATAGVVSRMNAVPVFVDIDPVTYNIDPVKIKEKITGKTKAIIPVHLYGQLADMDAIMEIGKDHGLAVIEDAAQAIGAQFKDGRRAGSIGLMGCFSFYPTKNLGGFGDGGMVITNDERLAVKLKQMRNHGMEPKYYHKFIGGNFRLDAIQATVLNRKFPHLEAWHQARRDNAGHYDKLFVSLSLAEETGRTKFDANNSILLPKAIYKESDITNYHIYNQYIIRAKDRDGLRSHLTSKGIGSEIYYPVPFHEQECFRDLPSAKDSYPVADRAAAETLALPIYPELAKDQIEYVVKSIAGYFNAD
ncbi:MAG: DegT/DnrJ/EryC1/StrS family aminotransferase [Candidatus Kapaibacterium sp.]